METFIFLLNILSAFINMIGASMMFLYSSKVDSQVWVHQPEELIEIEKDDAHKNNMVRRGMLLMAVGFLLQLTILCIDYFFIL